MMLVKTYKIIRGVIFFVSEYLHVKLHTRNCGNRVHFVLHLSVRVNRELGHEDSSFLVKYYARDPGMIVFL